MTREMLINTVPGQECRIAIVCDGRLEELYVERASSASHVGNIYKGRITNVESAIQAAFIDFGPTKNGFLHISDVHPQYFPDGVGAAEAVGRKRSHRDRPPIQDCLKRGQEVVVQMTKEGIGTKGPTMTTYVSIPGRLLVMMPGMSRMGVSRKIEDEEVRQRAKTILAELNVPDDMGFIVRTAGVDRSKRDMQRDLNYLLRLWKVVTGHVKRAKTPSLIYEESDLVTRTIRDIYSSDIKRVICDDQTVARTAMEFLKVAVPRGKHGVELYTGREGLFHDYGLESEIAKVYSRRVELASGGSLVIDQTEALVAIDVNSGRFRKHSDAETTATKLNIEAAGEIARQLRLRDMGGVVIIDFVDMRMEKNRRTVERTFRDAIKPDRAKTKVLRISTLGLLEMTRQRTGESLTSNVLRHCECCDGTGSIKSEESQALLVMRQLQRACAVDDIATVEVTVTPSVAHYLNNHQRDRIIRLETQTGRKIVITGDKELPGDGLKLSCVNARGSKVAWETNPSTRRPGKDVQAVPIEDVPVEEGQAAPTPSGGPVQTLDVDGDESAAPSKSKRRRRRRGGARHKRAGATDAPVEQEEPAGADEPEKEKDEKSPAAVEGAEAAPPADGEEQAAAKKPRRRGKRGGRKHKRPGAKSVAADAQGEKEEPADADEPEKDKQKDKEKDKKPAAAVEGAETAPPADGEEQADEKKPRRRGKRGGRKHKRSGDKSAAAEGESPSDDSANGDQPPVVQTPPAVDTADQAQSSETSGDDAPDKPKRRTRRRRKSAVKKTDEKKKAASEE